MIYIDLLVGLNLEDDQGRNVARLADAIAPSAVTPGALLVAVAPRAWSWTVVESIHSGFVYFRQISAQDAARSGQACGTACLFRVPGFGSDEEDDEVAIDTGRPAAGVDLRDRRPHMEPR